MECTDLLVWVLSWLFEWTQRKIKPFTYVVHFPFNPEYQFQVLIFLLSRDGGEASEGEGGVGGRYMILFMTLHCGSYCVSIAIWWLQL